MRAAVVFDAYDEHGGGSLAEAAFAKMLVDINTDPHAFSGNVGRAMAEFDLNGDGVIDFAEFTAVRRATFSAIIIGDSFAAAHEWRSSCSVSVWQLDSFHGDVLRAALRRRCTRGMHFWRSRPSECNSSYERRH